MSVNRKYYWLKLKEDFFSSKRIKKLRRLAGGDTYTIIYLKLQLVAMKNDGIISFTGLEKDIAEELSLELDEEVENVRVTLSYLMACGLAETSDDIHFFFPYAVEIVGSDTTAAQRMRRARAAQKAALEGEQCSPCVPPAFPDRSPEKEIEKEIDTDTDKEQEKDIGSAAEGKEQKKKPAKEKADAFSEFASDDPNLLATLHDFEKMRKASKKPMTDRAKQLLVNKLSREFSPEVWIAVLEQSISHNWADVYPLKDPAPSGGYRQQGRSRSEDSMEALGQLHEMFDEEG